MTLDPKRYTYQATLLRVVDGDTVWLTVDMGFRHRQDVDFRLAFINAPELSTVPVGPASKAWLQRKLMGLPATLLITSYKQDNYGRWLVEIHDPTDPRSVNQQMLDAGMAVPYPAVKP